MSKATFQTAFNTEYAQRDFNPQETLQWVSRAKHIYWCWGVSKKVNYNNKGLLLKVNGAKFKGWVLITLAWDDTYTVRYLNAQYNEALPMNENVYCDVLQDIIDRKIESGVM